jgi:hypothetical protein
MYWIMSTERSENNEAVLEIQSNSFGNESVNFACGKSKIVANENIVIDYQLGEGTNIYTDNLMCYGLKSLFFNEKIKRLLDYLDIKNIDYYEVALINVKNGGCLNYYIANIIGTFECVDYDNSEVELWPNGKIEQIDSLTFIDTSKMDLPPIFRLSSFLPLVIVNNEIKKAFEDNNITGLKFYKPEDFYL